MLEFPPFRLDAADQCVWRDDQRVPLTPKAFAVLHYLVKSPGRLVTQTELLEALWPDTFVQSEVLKSQILYIRTALGDSAKDPTFIETVPRRGYRFIAAVRDGAMRNSANPQPTPSPPAASKVVGRRNALEELKAAFERACVGDRQIVFVTGEQGMGKTTLIDAFLTEVAGSGTVIAAGQCLDTYGGVKEPYYPALEALSQLSRGPIAERLSNILEKYAPTWLIQLPALIRREHRETLQRELVGATRERMIREISEALEQLTEVTPIILLFEDLHWADPSTVDLISALAQRRQPARLLLLGTYRPVDITLAQHPLKQVSHSLKAKRLSKEIALPSLAQAEVAEYLLRQGGHSGEAGATARELAAWIHQQTEGNPLFMVTLFEHLVQLGHVTLDQGDWQIATELNRIKQSVPDTLRQMIEVQIERLTEDERSILQAASVQGNTFSIAITASALDSSEENVEQTCEKLAQQSHMIRAAPVEQLPNGTFSQCYEFVHAAFRSVFYQRLLPVKRAKLHRRLGQMLESVHAGGRAEIAGELAGHFELCGDWPKVVEYLSLAAKNAWHRFDYREAVSILEQARAAANKLPDAERIRVETPILVTIITQLHALHDSERLIPILELLIARAETFRMAEVGARALIGLTSLRARDDVRECGGLLDRILSSIPAQTSPLVQAPHRAQVASMRIMMLGWNAHLFEDHAADLAFLEQGPDRDAEALVRLDHAFLQWSASRYQHSIDNAQRSLPMLLETGRMVRYIQGRDLIATGLAFLGKWGPALDLLDQTIADAQKNEAPLRLAMPLLFKAWVHLNAMDFEGVLGICNRVRPLISEPYMRDIRLMLMRLEASATLGLGHHIAARERFLELQKSLDEVPVVLSWYWRIPLQINLADTYLSQGDFRQARREANRALEEAQATADRTWHALAWDLSARVALREALVGNDNGKVAHDVQHALAAMDGFDVPLAAWRVHYTAAKMHGANGSTELEAACAEASRTVVGSLAASLDTRPQLQRIFLNSKPIADILGYSPVVSAPE